jgi:choline monooxygenase
MASRLEELLRAFDPNRPLAQAHTIPSAWYWNPELADLERRAVFGDTWQAVGRTDQIDGPGTFFTADVAGEPLLVVRDDAGTLRAMANVCRHRGAVIVNELAGHATRLRCRYHGWTYDLTGRLRGVPEFDGVADFCREDNGLPAYAVDTWGPIVWAHLGRSQAPLLNTIEPLARRMAPLGVDKLHFAGRREYNLACNWKVFVDNYLDGGYHVNTVHPALAGVLDYGHYRTEIEGMTSVQISPLKATDDNVAAVRRGDHAYYWFVYPNLMLNVYDGVMDTNLVLPTGPETCRVVFDFYFAATAGDEAARFMADSIAVADRIQAEDVGICEEVQRGLRSRSYSTGRFSVRREAGGYHFHQMLARQLRAADSV